MHPHGASPEPHHLPGTQRLVATCEPPQIHEYLQNSASRFVNLKTPLKPKHKKFAALV